MLGDGSMEHEQDSDWHANQTKSRRKRSFMPIVFLGFIGLTAASLIAGFMVLNSNAEPDYDFTGVDIPDTSVPIEGFEITEQSETDFEFESEIQAPE